MLVVILSIGILLLYVLWRVIIHTLDQDIRDRWGKEAPQDAPPTERALRVDLRTNPTLFRAGS